MEIVTKTIKYTWKHGNRLSIDDKVIIAKLYLEGYAVYNIAKSFNVTPTTIQYQLEVMGVYMKNSRPTLWNQDIVIKRITYSTQTLIQPKKKVTVPLHILTINQRFIREDAQERQYEHTKPSMYSEIQRKQKLIHKTFSSPYLVPKPIMHESSNFKPMIIITL